MSKNLIDLLRDGLLHLRIGGTVQEYLERPELNEVPGDRLSELRSLLETAATITSLRGIPVPSPKATAANRARFLSAAAALHESRPGWRSIVRWTMWPRLLRTAVSVSLILALLLGAGTGMVRVAASSLPGSALYPIKLAVEDARLMLAVGELRRAELYLRYANERTDEMLRLSAAGQPVNQAVTDRFALQLEGAVAAASSAARSEPGAAMGILEEVIKTASVQHSTLTEACEMASETVQPALNAGAAAAQHAGQVAQQELAQLIAVLPTATQLAQLPATATSTPRRSAPAATPVPPTIAEPSQPPPPPLNPVNTEATAPRPTASGPTTVPSDAARTISPGVSPTLSSVPSGTAPPPGPSRTIINPTTTLRPEFTATSPLATSPADDGAVTPTLRAARLRVDLADSGDPVPASFRIHYKVCVVNEGESSLTNASVKVRWTPTQCAYAPPDNPSELVFAVGSVAADSRSCVSFSLNTSVICGGTQISAEAVATCDQGSASDVETTTLAPPPTPTPTVTRTPMVLFNVTLSDQPDPVTAGNALHLELCVVNYGDQTLTNVVLQDVWTPRDCVYLPPDNPFDMRWIWKSVAEHSQRCVTLTLSSYSTCEGALVSNKATMTCDQGTASAEEMTAVRRPPTVTPTIIATATLTERPVSTPTPPATTIETPAPSPTSTATLPEVNSPRPATR